MTRSMIAAGALVVILLAGVVVGAAALVASDRRALAEQFAANRVTEVQEVAELTKKDVDNVAAALRFAGQITRKASAAEERQRELRGLLVALPAYEAIGAYWLARGEHIVSMSPRTVSRSARCALRPVASA